MPKLLYRLFFIWCLLQVAAAQDLQQIWSTYADSDENLARAESNCERLRADQTVLQAEISALQENRNWYNGWISELLIARKTATVTVLSDSLTVTSRRCRILDDQREAAFDELKKAYRQVLNTGELDVRDKEQAIVLGDLILRHDDGTLELPDYTNLLTREFENQAVAELVFRDLQTLLAFKLGLIDSVLAQRREERELLERLNEFQRDLSLLQESNRDLVAPPATRADYSTAEAVDGTDVNATFGGWNEPDKTGGGLENVTAIDREQSGATPVSASGDYFERRGSAAAGEIDRLLAKQRQYRQILDRLGSEISQPD
ncbi:MAG: hypothetical protein ABIA75_10205 [Candidatus Neomarinimicrobiota bacterium]